MTDARQTETLTIEGMTCTHCVAAVRAALESVPGASVLSVKVGRAEVSFDPAETDRQRLADVIDEAGFDVVDA